MKRLVPALALLLASGCQKEFKPDPQQAADGYYLKGTTEYLHGNFDAALAAFAEARKYAPSDPRLPAAVGEVYLARGKLDEALAEFEDAVKRDPGRATSWSRLGFIQAQQGRGAEARVALEKAIALNKDDFNALEQLADLRLKEGQLDEAVRFYAQAARASPEASKGLLFLKAAEALRKQKRDEAARALLQSAAQEAPRSAEVAQALADVQVHLGALAAALDSYRKSAALASGDPVPWELAGRIAARLGRLDEAEAAFQKSLEVKQRAVAHVALANLYLGRGNKDAARQELEKALAVASKAQEEAPDETLELVDLLVAFDRKRDALALVKLLADAPEAQKDVDLQLQTARLARDAGDKATLQAACDRVLAARKSGKCP
jgi:tetratricopeptide (TPR) repeat protein